MYLKFNDEVVEPPLSGPSELMGPNCPSYNLPHHKQSEKTIKCGSFMTDPFKFNYIPTPLAEQWRTGDAEHSRP